MKNKNAFEGIEPDVDGTYDSHIIDLQRPFTTEEKIRQEHHLRNLEENAYWRGYNDGIDACRALLDQAYDFNGPDE